MEDFLRTPLYHTLRTNQMGYIKVKAQLPGIYGNVNRPCPRAAPSDSGRFTAINPWRLGFNYYISYSYTIALSGLFELCARGGCLNYEAKSSGLNAHLERTIQ